MGKCPGYSKASQKLVGKNVILCRDINEGLSEKVTYKEAQRKRRKRRKQPPSIRQRERQMQSPEAEHVPVCPAGSTEASAAGRRSEGQGETRSEKGPHEVKSCSPRREFTFYSE